MRSSNVSRPSLFIKKLRRKSRLHIIRIDEDGGFLQKESL